MVDNKKISKTQDLLRKISKIFSLTLLSLHNFRTFQEKVVINRQKLAVLEKNRKIFQNSIFLVKKSLFRKRAIVLQWN